MPSRQRHRDTKADNTYEIQLRQSEPKSRWNWAETSDSITSSSATMFKICQMFHKRRTASRPAESWQSMCGGTAEGWGLARTKRVVGVMLPRPRLGRRPRGSRKNSGNIRAQRVCMRKKETEAWTMKGKHLSAIIKGGINPIVEHWEYGMQRYAGVMM